MQLHQSLTGLLKLELMDIKSSRELGVRSRESGVGSWKTEVGSWKTEVKSQKLGVNKKDEK